MLRAVLILIALAVAVHALECVVRSRRRGAGMPARSALVWGLALVVTPVVAAAVAERVLPVALAGAVFAGAIGFLAVVRAIRRRPASGLVTGAAALIPLAVVAGLVARTDERARLWPDGVVALGLGLGLLAAAERLRPVPESVRRAADAGVGRRILDGIGTAAALAVVAVLTGAGVVAAAGMNTADSLSAREISWGEADFRDHTRFPARTIPAAAPTYRFARAREQPAPRVHVREGERVVERDLDRFLAATGTLAFVLIKDGRVLRERYFQGHRRESVVTSFSVAKSFNSAMIGVAVAEGDIRGVDDPVTRYVPELRERDVRFERITLRHLLSMSSGLRYEESPLPWNDGAITYYDPDLRDAAIHDTEVVSGPAEEFVYNNYNPLLLGLVIERATGRAVSEYLAAKLWGPLGMEADGSWSLDSDADGFEKMESGINGRAIDFAKLGQLYLDLGRWRGRQLVPRRWVQESTAIDTTKDPSPDYQYGWWTTTGPAGPAFMAEGNFGQYVYVAPERGVVIARFGRSYGYGHRFSQGLEGTWPEIFGELAAGV